MWVSRSPLGWPQPNLHICCAPNLVAVQWVLARDFTNAKTTNEGNLLKPRLINLDMRLTRSGNPKFDKSPLADSRCQEVPDACSPGRFQQVFGDMSLHFWFGTIGDLLKDGQGVDVVVGGVDRGEDGVVEPIGLAPV